MKLGRTRPDYSVVHPQFAVAVPDGATLPAACNYGPKGQPALSNVYLNDQLGCCVVAGGYHVLATATGNVGKLFTATDDQITKDYTAIGGYVPGDSSTDQGCDEVTALNFWQKTGFADKSKITSWAYIDPTNVAHVKAALYSLENLYLGVELPDAWVNPMPSEDGFVWGVAGDPVPENGHCIIAVGYNADGVIVDTWGLLGIVTWAALAKYFSADANGNCFVILTPDQLVKASAKAPNGLNWTALEREIWSIHAR